MIVGTVFTMKENCHHDHIPFNVKGNGIRVFSVKTSDFFESIAMRWLTTNIWDPRCKEKSILLFNQLMKNPFDRSLLVNFTYFDAILPNKLPYHRSGCISWDKVARPIRFIPVSFSIRLAYL